MAVAVAAAVVVALATAAVMATAVAAAATAMMVPLTPTFGSHCRRPATLTHFTHDPACLWALSSWRSVQRSL